MLLKGTLVFVALMVGLVLTTTGSLPTVRAAHQTTQKEIKVTSAGQKIAAEKCSSCHAFTPVEQSDVLESARNEGPPLAFAGNKFQKEWLENWLVSTSRIRPAGYLSYRYVVSTPSGDRIDESRLPEHPTLSASDASHVAAYLATLKREGIASQRVSPSTSIRAELHFEKILGCGSCHQAQLGRGGLSGPELYTSYKRLDREWVVSFIAEPAKWALTPMPKVSLHDNQLAAIRDYIFQTPAVNSLPSATVTKPKERRATQAANSLPSGRGEAIYQLLCTQCHGVNGNGKGINSPALFVAPRDHTSFQEMSILTDDRIFAAIKFGGAAVGKSSLMPAWNSILKDADIQLLVDYLRGLSQTRVAANYEPKTTKEHQTRSNNGRWPRDSRRNRP